MICLRQSTSVDLPIGPFLDDTDGKTAESALTITQPDIRLKKNGGNWAQKNASQTLSHEEAGWYEVTLDATDTDTVGQLVVAIHESGALPVWRTFTVLEEAMYDWLFGASAPNTATPLDAAGVRTALGMASANLDTQLETIDNFLDTEVAAIKAKTDNLPDDPADQSAVEAAITAATSGLSTLNAAGVRTAVGLASANLDSQLDALPTAAEITTAVLAGQCDGVAVSKCLEVLLAAMAGKVSANSSGGVTTLTYKMRDGSTTSFTTVVTEADNTRATTGALS